MTIFLESFLDAMVVDPKRIDRFEIEIKDLEHKFLYKGLFRDFYEYHKLSYKLRFRSVYKWAVVNKYRIVIIVS